MKSHNQRLIFRRVLMLTLTLTSLFMTINFLQVRGLTWNTVQQVPMGADLTADVKMRFFDASPAVGTALKLDPRIKFIDTNNNGKWDPGEPVVYDVNNNGIYDFGEPLVAGIAPVRGSPVKSDPLIKFVDTSLHNVWEPGDTVVYDPNNNNMYDSGERVIAGTTPPLGASLSSDAKVKFVNSTSNPSETWTSGKSVVYDSNNNGLYDASYDPRIKFVDTNNNGKWDPSKPVVYDTNSNGFYDSGEPVIAGGTPAPGTVLKNDPLLKFVDTNRSGVWSSGEPVVYDSNNNNVFDSGEPLVAGAAPPVSSPLSLESHFKYVNSTTSPSETWAPGKTVVYDSNNDNLYSAWTDSRIRFVNITNNPAETWATGKPVVVATQSSVSLCGVPNLFVHQDPVINGTAPTDCTPIRTDTKFRFVDSSRKGIWVAGETILYDTNNDNVYDAGDVKLGPLGAVAPPLGTLLSEPALSGAAPAVGTKLRADSKIGYFDSDSNNLWEPGEAIVYDNNGNTIYDLGEPVVSGVAPLAGSLLSEPVIAGPLPAIGAKIRVDPRIKYVDLNKNGVYDPGEPLVYDANNNGSYDKGEPVIAGGAGGDGVWDVGEPVLYDSNNNQAYDTGEPVIAGTAPLAGTNLTSDAHIKFIDAFGSGTWHVGSTVVYDTNNNWVYDPGEPIITGAAPNTMIVTHPRNVIDQTGKIWLVWDEADDGLNSDVFFKIWNGTAWSQKQAVTTDPGVDNTASILSLSNRTMMILWASNRTGHANVFSRLYSYSAGSKPSPLTGNVQLTLNNTLDKIHVWDNTSPSAVQDRLGRIWLTWTASDSDGNDLYYKNFNGTSWSNDFPVPTASTTILDEHAQAITQTKDGKIWIAFASNDTANTNLYYTTTDGSITTIPSNGLPAASWTTRKIFFTDSSNHNESPSIIQARDGTLWVFFNRSPPLVAQSNIYSTSSSDNGATWTTPVAVTSPPNSDSTPTVVQMGYPDDRLWLFWDRRGTSQLEVWYSQSDPIASIRDVGINTATVQKRLVRNYYPINVSVTVSNYGDNIENPNLTFSLNNVNETSVRVTSLNQGESRLVWINWTSPQGFWGKYNLTITLQPAPGENPINLGDDTVKTGLVRISPPGDVDGNGNVDILDASALAIAFDTKRGDPKYNPYADINRDGSIDILDASALGYHFDQTVWP